MPPVISAAEFAREAIAELADQHAWAVKHEGEQTDTCLKIHWHGTVMASGLAKHVVEKLAAKHGIELDTPATKGTP